MYTVKDIMKTVVCTIPDDKTVSEVEGILVEESISGAPIVSEEGNVVGLISQSDIVHFDFIGGDTYNTPAIEIATYNVITVRTVDTVQHAAMEMKMNDIHRLLVVEDGRVAGIVTSTDIVKLVGEKGIAE